MFILMINQRNTNLNKMLFTVKIYTADKDEQIYAQINSNF